ncbi:hypothetical protein WJX79_009548 [Trebouxia sp. C0005]
MSVSTGVACNKTTKPLAGDCSFYDLPLTLLYNICGSMDIESQRNLFMVSPYLYTTEPVRCGSISQAYVDAWAAHQAAKLDVEFDIFDQHYEEFP